MGHITHHWEAREPYMSLREARELYMSLREARMGPYYLSGRLEWAHITSQGG